MTHGLLGICLYLSEAFQRAGQRKIFCLVFDVPLLFPVFFDCRFFLFFSMRIISIWIMRWYYCFPTSLPISAPWTIFTWWRHRSSSGRSTLGSRQVSNLWQDIFASPPPPSNNNLTSRTLDRSSAPHFAVTSLSRIRRRDCRDDY